jgi:hypothetical protein
MTAKLSHERNVRSFAKKTFGSTRTGREMRLPKERQGLLALMFSEAVDACSLIIVRDVARAYQEHSEVVVEKT